MGLADKQSLLEEIAAKAAANNTEQERGNDNDTFVEGVFCAKITGIKVGEREDGNAYGVYNFTVEQPGDDNHGKRGVAWADLEHPVGFEIFMTSMQRAGLDCTDVLQLPTQVEDIKGKYFEIACKRQEDKQGNTDDEGNLRVYSNFKIYSPLSAAPDAGEFAKTASVTAPETASVTSADPEQQAFDAVYDNAECTIKDCVELMKTLKMRKTKEPKKLIEEDDIDGLLDYIAETKGFSVPDED
jgi:hypothetical protein